MKLKFLLLFTVIAYQSTIICSESPPYNLMVQSKPQTHPNRCKKHIKSIAATVIFAALATTGISLILKESSSSPTATSLLPACNDTSVIQPECNNTTPVIVPVQCNDTAVKDWSVISNFQVVAYNCGGCTRRSDSFFNDPHWEMWLNIPYYKDLIKTKYCKTDAQVCFERSNCTQALYTQDSCCDKGTNFDDHAHMRRFAKCDANDKTQYPYTNCPMKEYCDLPTSCYPPPSYQTTSEVLKSQAKTKRPAKVQTLFKKIKQSRKQAFNSGR